MKEACQINSQNLCCSDLLLNCIVAAWFTQPVHVMLFQTMEYHVKWDKHERSISEAFRSLRHDEHLCDVTLACGDRQFQAHKVVLSAGSSFFEQVLKNHKHPCPLVYLRGVEANHMELLLNFIYSGEVALKQDMLENFLKTGDELGVKGLTGSTDTESTIERVRQATPMQDKGDQNKENLQIQMEASSTLEIQAPVEQDQGNSKSMEAEEVDRKPNIIQNTQSIFDRDFSSIQMSSPKTIVSPFSAPTISSVNESAVLEDSKEMLGDSQAIVKKKELDCNAGVLEAAVKSEKPENQIKEWNDLREYATVVQKGAHGSGKKPVLQCSLCGKIVSHGNIEVMMIHIESLHFKGFLNHTCPVCQKTFEAKSLLNHHKHRKHKK